MIALCVQAQVFLGVLSLSHLKKEYKRMSAAPALNADD